MNRNGVVTVVQVRTGSKRLPAKVLLPLGGATVLERLLERLSASALAGTIVVATTTDHSDDSIPMLCRRIDVPWVRGHATDLLERHRQAAEAFHAHHIVKIPSDCPLIDPREVDEVIGRYLAESDRVDYVSNLHPATQPDGCDVEIFSREALERACHEAVQPHEREHTTPYFWEQAGRFRTANVQRLDGRDFSRSHRVVLDYLEDFMVIRRVFDGLYPLDPLFTMDDIVLWLDAHPEVTRLNEKFRGVNWYRDHLEARRAMAVPGNGLHAESRA